MVYVPAIQRAPPSLFFPAKPSTINRYHLCHNSSDGEVSFCFAECDWKSSAVMLHWPECSASLLFSTHSDIEIEGWCNFALLALWGGKHLNWRNFPRFPLALMTILKGRKELENCQKDWFDRKSAAADLLFCRNGRPASYSRTPARDLEEMTDYVMRTIGH